MSDQTDFPDPTEIRHLIGAAGSFSLHNISGDISLRGDDGDEVVVRARTDDGGCCTCTNLVTATLLHDVLVLPVSVKLSTEKGEPLPTGRYSITVTLDTVGAAQLRPSARLPFEIVAIH